MKLIVGLGNPGRLYANSRHNAGFLVVKALARASKGSFKKERDGLSFSCRVSLGGEQLVLALPLTYMNLSGVAVSALVKKYKIDIEGLLVVCDDLDLALGRIKIRPRGSSGGHRGIASVIESLGANEFCRLRVGIGRPSSGRVDTAGYVLSEFLKKEKEAIEEAVRRSVCCCEAWAARGVAYSMNVFNKNENL